MVICKAPLISMKVQWGWLKVLGGLVLPNEGRLKRPILAKGTNRNEWDETEDLGSRSPGHCREISQYLNRRQKVLCFHFRHWWVINNVFISYTLLTAVHIYPLLWRSFIAPSFSEEGRMSAVSPRMTPAGAGDSSSARAARVALTHPQSLTALQTSQVVCSSCLLRLLHWKALAGVIQLILKMWAGRKAG